MAKKRYKVGKNVFVKGKSCTMVGCFRKRKRKIKNKLYGYRKWFV